MTDQEPQRKKGGRPRKHSPDAKRPTMAFRMGSHLHEQLIVSAAANERSLSEEIERRLEDSYRESEDRNFVKSMLGGSSDAISLIMSISVAAKTIEKLRDKSGRIKNSSDWASHEPTRAAIRAAVVRITEHATAPIREYTADLQEKAEELQEKNRLDKSSITNEDIVFMHYVSDILQSQRMAQAGRRIAEVLIGELDIDFLADQNRSAGILADLDDGE